MTTGCNGNYLRAYNERAQGVQVTPNLNESISKLLPQIVEQQRKSFDIQELLGRDDGRKRRHDELEKELPILPSIKEFDEITKRPREGQREKFTLTPPIVSEQVHEVSLRTQISRPIIEKPKNFMVEDLLFSDSPGSVQQNTRPVQQNKCSLTSTEASILDESHGITRKKSAEPQKPDIVCDYFLTFGELVRFLNELIERKPTIDEDWKLLAQEVFRNRKNYSYLKIMLDKIHREAIRLNPSIQRDSYGSMLELVNSGELQHLIYFRMQVGSDNWSEKQHMKLINLVLARYKIRQFFHNDDWEDIAKNIEGKNACACKNRWDKNYRFFNPWTLRNLKNLIMSFKDFQGQDNVWERICDKHFKVFFPSEYLRRPEQAEEKFKIIIREYHKYKECQILGLSYYDASKIGIVESVESIDDDILDDISDINFDELLKFVTNFYYPKRAFRENTYYLR